MSTMSTRQILAAIVIVPLLAGMSSATAAPPKKKPVKKPTCFLMKDGTADATQSGTSVAAPNDPNMDIVTADIATNAQTFTAVVRLAAMEDKTNTNWTLGTAYTVGFRTAGGLNTVQAIVSPAGTTWAAGNGSGTVDKTKKEIRIHIPISKLKFPPKPNEKLTEYYAQTARYVGTTTITAGWADRVDAAPPGYYVHAWPSCVKVGA
jgi:hypothetical protein